MAYLISRLPVLAASLIGRSVLLTAKENPTVMGLVEVWDSESRSEMILLSPTSLSITIKAVINSSAFKQSAMLTEASKIIGVDRFWQSTEPENYRGNRRWSQFR